MTIESLQIVAKSLSVNRLRLALIGAISSIIAINATFLIHILDPVGRLVVTVLVFVFASLPTFIILLDIMSHSHQSIAVFQALGAEKYTVMTAALIGLVGVGFIGAATGVILGLLLTNFYGSLSPAFLATIKTADTLQLLLSATYVLASCSAGIAAGVILGVRVSWGKLR